MNCPACGTAAPASAKFCHHCGTDLRPAPPPETVSQPAGWRAGLPWGIAGAAVGALLAVIIMRLTKSGTSPDAPPPLAAPGGGGGGAAAVDISQMSPEERASRLFNRVMILAQAGKQDSVSFFLPMAIASYQQLPALDNDARYHIGLLQLAGGNTTAAMAQADTILKNTPTHLFGFLLRAHTYQQLGNARAERRAYGDFLKHESAERARNRPEYEDHKGALDAFHQEAVRQQAGGAGGVGGQVRQ
jgi:zinc ribbon protein